MVGIFAILKVPKTYDLLLPTSCQAIFYSVYYVFWYTDYCFLQNIP